MPTLFLVLKSLCLTLIPVPYSAKFLNKFDLAGIFVGMASSADMGPCE